MSYSELNDHASDGEFNNALVVDDNPQTCLLLKQLLESAGCMATIATSLKQAYSELEKKEFNHLFLDLHMPDGSGIDVISKVKSKYPHMRIIIISAWDGSKERLEAQTEGADHFIAKPFTAASIKLAIQQPV